MTKSVWGMTAVLVLCLGLSLPVTAQQTSAADLMPFLQAEVNEIAMLNAQWNYLQQQGDALGAAVVASYIPDHQMQATNLRTLIVARGGDPTQIVPNANPMVGTRLDIINTDIQAHQAVANDYQQLATRAGTADPTVQQLATMGQSGAMRHWNSLRVARGVTTGTPGDLTDATIASLALERTAVADLQAQATQLRQLNDIASAQAIEALIPAHQQQAQTLEALVKQMGGDTGQATAAPVVALSTRDQIMNHLRIADTQMINTYAVAIASLPPSPMRTAFMQGQQVALTGYTTILGCPMTA